jgi:phage portal protein BeeE
MPWLNRWERLIERSLFSADGRRNYEVEFDTDLLLRGDMLTRFQAYRIAREIGVYNANELRGFEKANPRTDADGDTYFAPRQMQPEQTNQPIADRGGGNG